MSLIGRYINDNKNRGCLNLVSNITLSGSYSTTMEGVYTKQCLSFTGGEGYTTNPFVGLNNWSLCFWYRADTPGTWTDIFTFSGDKQRIEYSAANGSRLTWYNNGTSYGKLFETGTRLKDGLSNSTWYHICITFSSGVAKFYLDGSLLLTNNSAVKFTSDGTNRIYFGSRIGSDYSLTSFNDIRYYNHTLTQEEIDEIQKMQLVDLSLGFEDVSCPLTWVQSTSNHEYIDTGINANSYAGRLKWVMDGQWVSNAEGHQGCMGGGYRFHCSLWNSGFHPGLSNGYSASGTWDTNRHVFVLDAKAKTFMVDSTVYPISGWTSTPTSTTLPSYNIYLFQCNNAGSIATAPSFRLYRCKFYDGDTLLRDFVPWRYGTTIGLMDISHNVFYAASNGNLVAEKLTSQLQTTTVGGASWWFGNITLTGKDGSMSTSGGAVATFNGTNSVISMTSTSDANNYLRPYFTVCAWVKWTQFTTYSRFFDISTAASGAGWTIGVCLADTSGNLLLFGRLGSSSDAFNLDIGHQVTLNQWVHIAVRVSYSDVYVYINGTSKGSWNLGKTFGGRVFSNIYLGRSSWSSDPHFKGCMYDFKLYNSSLSAAEIKKIYNVKAELFNTGSFHCCRLSEENEMTKGLTDGSVYYSSGFVEGDSCSISGGYKIANCLKNATNNSGGYIDTGLAAGWGYTFEGDVSINVADLGGHFLGITGFVPIGITSSGWRIQHPGGWASSSIKATANVVYHVKAVMNSGSQKLYVNDVNVVSASNTTTPDSRNIYMFTRNGNPSGDGPYAFTIYNMIISKDNKPVRHFVPAYRISDAKVGMYDTLNGVFYENKTNVAFTYNTLIDGSGRTTMKEFVED